MKTVTITTLTTSLPSQEERTLQGTFVATITFHPHKLGVIATWQMTKLRPREAKSLAQSAIPGLEDIPGLEPGMLYMF